MTLRNVKGDAQSEEPTKNFYQLCSSTVRDTVASFSTLFWPRNFTVWVQSHRSHQTGFQQQLFSVKNPTQQTANGQS